MGGIVARRCPPAHPAAPRDMRRCDRGLLADKVHARDNAEDPLPVPRVGGEEHAPARPGHPREQSPVVLRSLLRAVPGAAEGDLPGQVGVLHRTRAEGADQQGLLHRRRRDSPGPRRGAGQRAGDQDRPAGPGGREGARHLPGGHPEPGRPPVPGQDGRGQAGRRIRRPGRPVRDDRHLPAPAAGQAPARTCGSGPACGSASRWTSPATTASRRTRSYCGRSPTRSCRRSRSSPARSTSTSTPVAPRPNSPQIQDKTTP